MGFLDKLAQKLMPVPRELGHLMCKDAKNYFYMVTLYEEKKRKEIVYTMNYEIGHHNMKDGPYQYSEELEITDFVSREAFKTAFYNKKGLGSFPESDFENLWDQICDKLGIIEKINVK